MSWPNKLECSIALGWKGLPGTNTSAYLTPSQVTHTSLFGPFLSSYTLQHIWSNLKLHSKGLSGTNNLTCPGHY